MDKIVIKDLELDAYIGVTESERARAQRLLVTVELELDLRLAGRTDTATATTPYDVVADLIRQEVTKKPRKLIEAVADEIAEAILSRRLAMRVAVEVKKFSVVRTQWVAVQITRSQ
jgi:dihydroneopterin aldolase